MANEVDYYYESIRAMADEAIKLLEVDKMRFEKGDGVASAAGIHRMLKGVIKMDTTVFDGLVENVTSRRGIGEILFNHKFPDNNNGHVLSELATSQLGRLKVQKQRYLKRFCQEYINISDADWKNYVNKTIRLEVTGNSKDPQKPPSSSPPISASSTSSRTKSTRVKPRRVSTATQRSSHRARGSFRRRSTSNLINKNPAEMVAKFHIDDRALPANVKKLGDITDPNLCILLVQYIREYIHIKDSRKLHAAIVSFPALPEKCTNLVMASTRLILNGMKYLIFNDAEKQEIGKKLEITGNNAANLQRLLNGVNLNSIIFRALPAGARFAPKDPAIMAVGTWATVHLLEIVFKNLIETPTRIASRASALKQIAGSTELYVNSDQSDEAEFIVLWACYGGFSGAIHENASLRHRVLKIDLSITDDMAREIKEKIDEVDFFSACKNAFDEIVTDIAPCDSSEQSDQFFSQMIKSMNAAIVKKTRFIIIRSHQEVKWFAAGQLALMHEGVNHFSLCVAGDFQMVVKEANQVFSAIFHKHPKFINMEMLGVVSSQTELEGCAALFPKILLDQDVLTDTAPITCEVNYYPMVDGPHYSDVFRCQSDETEVNIVTRSNQVPNIVDGKLAVTGGRGSISIQTCTKLTQGYKWNDFNGYVDESPQAVSDIHVRTLPPRNSPALKSYSPNVPQSPHH